MVRLADDRKSPELRRNFRNLNAQFRHQVSHIQLVLIHNSAFLTHIASKDA